MKLRQFKCRCSYSTVPEALKKQQKKRETNSNNYSAENVDRHVHNNLNGCANV